MARQAMPISSRWFQGAILTYLLGFTVLGVLAYLVLIPAIKFFGEGSTTALTPGTVPISEMEPDAIRDA